MTFSDIFKSSFLEKVSSFSLLDMLIALGLSFVLGLFIFFIYKKSFRGVMYSSSFGLSLIAMSLITTLVILAVTSNVVLSLGMVGALSIVRFRTAVKEPMDIAFLFWAISVGIVLGAGLIPLAILGSVVIGLILLVFANRKTNDTPYMVVATLSDGDAEEAFMAAVREGSRKCQLKSKTVAKDRTELTVEIRLRDPAADFVNLAAELPGVDHVVLVTYNGEYLA